METLRLIAYEKVEPEDTSYAIPEHGDWVRLWTLVKYMPVEGLAQQYHTAEFCVKIAPMPDFCGGMIVCSPQVSFHSRDGWTGKSGFCSPGTVPSLGNLGWSTLDDPETGKNRAVDLGALTGKAQWTQEEVKEYGHECIAASVFGELLHRGCRGWVASDHVEGNMRRVHDIMCSYQNRAAMIGHPMRTRKIGCQKHPPCGTERGAVNITARDTTGESYYNSNSGNMVNLLTGNYEFTCAYEIGEGIECENCGQMFDFDGRLDCECWECGHGIDDCDSGKNVITIHEEIVSCYDNAMFINQARRFEWSNG